VSKKLKKITIQNNLKNQKKVRNMIEIGKGRYIFGTVKVGQRGQIVIPKEARDVFNIKTGDLLLVVGDEAKGLALVKAESMKKLALSILNELGGDKDE
jgi:AbrB family looped-hinge helix DNA binding protein